MRLPSDGTPRDPRILCVGLALRQALPVLPFDPRLTAAVNIIVREAERFQPDPFELTYAWDTALHVLLDMATECRCGPLGDILIQHLTTPPYTDDAR